MADMNADTKMTAENTAEITTNLTQIPSFADQDTETETETVTAADAEGAGEDTGTGTETGAAERNAQAEKPESSEREPDDKAGAEWKLTLTEEERAQFPITDELLAEMEEKARALGLTEKQARGLLAYRAEQYAAWVRQQKEAEAAQAEAWKEMVLADREIGGNERRIRASNAAAARALKVFGSEELRNLLVSTGYEFHPEIRRALVRAGKAIGEAEAVRGKDTAGSGDGRSLAERMYPSM